MAAGAAAAIPDPCLRAAFDAALKKSCDRMVNFDPRGPCPPATGKGGGAANRYASKERKLAKKLPAGVPLSAIYIDEQGRADMSWRNVPDSEASRGAKWPRPRERQRRGKADPCR